jgi:hypothetical protein
MFPIDGTGAPHPRFGIAVSRIASEGWIYPAVDSAHLTRRIDPSLSYVGV